jgi:hypothetical protein
MENIDPVTLTGVTLRRAVSLGNYETLHLEASYQVNDPEMTLHQVVNLIHSELETECDRLKVQHKFKNNPSKSKKTYGQKTQAQSFAPKAAETKLETEEKEDFIF